MPRSIYTNVFLLFLASLALPLMLYSQQRPVQNIRGTVIESILKTPLAGATIMLQDDSTKATQSSSVGSFILAQVPVGRHNILVSFSGYKPVFLTSIEVESGKETMVNIEMEQVENKLHEIYVTAIRDKSLPVNPLAIVSARKLSVEETRRFAAGINDLSRIAAGFAGVANNSSDGNALIIRGNAPNTLLWRLEGVDIPNPNHFARVGTSGGAISILSAQLLDNSDLMMGAFPAEYGNALSGVFDVHLRRGNNKKREHTAMISIMGVDLATEGYFNKKYDGSYLVNYRYNILSLIQKMHLYKQDAPTEFQDLSFNIYLPLKKAGRLTFFGFGGKSKQEELASGDSLTWLHDPSKRKGALDESNTGATGITHELAIGNKTLLKSIVSLNGYKYREDDNHLDKFNGPLITTRNNSFQEWDAVVSLGLDHKFNSRQLLRAGIYATAKHFDLLQKEVVNNVFQNKVATNGNTSIVNSYVEWKWDLSNTLMLLTGFHGQYLFLNATKSLDPRLAIRWRAGNRQYFNFGFGQHSQMQPLGNYFARIKVGTDSITPNKGMDFSKAHHFVLGYTNNFSANWHFKTEAYYQQLYNIPVTAGRSTSFSLVNQEDNYVIDKQQNSGKGKNYGIEFTLERSWNDLFYMIATTSLYESKYLASDNVWRNTRFNSNTGYTFLSGKEWAFQHMKRPSSFSVDLKVVQNGGVRVTPIDLSKSVQQKKTVLDNTRIYGEKLPAYFRIDLQVAWKTQFRRMTFSVLAGVQNLTDHLNPTSQSFEPVTNSITYNYLLGRIPLFAVKADF